MINVKSELERIGYKFHQEDNSWYFLAPKNKKSQTFKSSEQAIDRAYKHALQHGLFEE